MRQYICLHLSNTVTDLLVVEALWVPNFVFGVKCLAVSLKQAVINGFCMFNEESV